MFVRTSLLTELEYRANFAAQFFLGVFWAFITLISVWVFFSHTSTLGGWTYSQALVVVGVFALVNSLIECLLEPNVKRLIEMVRQGTLDFVLTKPVNSQFMATLRYTRLNGLGDFVSGILMIIWAFSQMNYSPALPALLKFIFVFLMGFLTIYGIWVLIATTSFWLVKVNNLTEFFRAIFETGRFPVSTFRGVLRVVLTYIMPIAFITTIPAQALLDKIDVITLPISALIASIAFLGSHQIWNYAIRNYSSASS
jgi:ABC-2 type transport system permease protein